MTDSTASRPTFQNWLIIIIASIGFLFDTYELLMFPVIGADSVAELIKANKDFDLIMLPNRTHGFGNEPYMVRRRWDYFVRYLLGAEPPKDYELKTPPAQ